MYIQMDAQLQEVHKVLLYHVNCIHIFLGVKSDRFFLNLSCHPQSQIFSLLLNVESKYVKGMRMKDTYKDAESSSFT